MKSVNANTEQRVAEALQGITLLFDLKTGSHLSRAHVMNFLRDSGQPDYLVSDVIRGLQTAGVEILDAADNGGAATASGSLDAFFQQSNIADLAWLAVDREMYRETEVLPVQNLDMAPDLAEAWDHSDSAPGIHLVPARPNDSMASSLEVERGSAKANRAAQIIAARNVAEGLWRTMRVAMTEGRSFQVAKTLAFSQLDGIDMPLGMKRALRKHLVEGVGKLASEEGLLGNVFVVAQDYPHCDQTQGIPRTVANSKAPFVIAKASCQGCRFAHGGSACAQFRKRLVLEVPYDEDLARRLQVASSSSSPDDVKAAIRKAFTAQPVKHVPLDGKPVQADFSANITVEEAALALQKQAAEDAAKKAAAEKAAAINGVVVYARSRMNEGKVGKALLESIVTHYPEPLVRMAAEELKTVFAEQGLAGHYYIDAEAYPNCQTGDVGNLHRVRASLMQSVPPFVQQKQACAGCPCNQGGRCSVLKAHLVDKVDYSPWGGRKAALVGTLTGHRSRVANEWHDEFGLQTPQVHVSYDGLGTDVSGIDLQDAEFHIEW